MDRKPTRTPIALLALLLAALAGCVVEPTVAVGNRAPAFAAASLDGETVALGDLRGDVVMLNIWATWCFPCRREMPSFEALHREYGEDGFRVVAVSIDKHGAEREIRDFLEEYGITFTVLYDPDHEIVRRFNTIGVPETFLIDRNGVVVRHWIGRIDGHSELIRAPIRDALGGRLASRG
jgi:cytochrome c biogenesis protein CcmG, thiol:disulfide interchange protein DsbE